MSSRIAALDRFIVFLTGLIFLAAGAWAVGLFFDVRFAQQLADFIDFPAWRSAPEQGWFDPALIALMIAALVVGGWLIALNLRTYRISRVHSPASDSTGLIDINLAALASAMADRLEAHPKVESVQHRVAESWGRPTLTLTARARAGLDVAALRAAVEAADRDFRAATPGIDVDTEYRIHLLPVER